MSTVIDELVMAFGLDGSKFEAGAKKASGNLKKLKEDAGKTAKDMEAEGQKAARFFTQMQTAAIQFFGVLAGATGLTQMITQVVALEAQLGRLADRTGQASESLQAFGNVAELFGGKAEDMQAGMSALSQAMVNMKYKGEMSPTLMLFSQLGVRIADANGQMRDQSDILLDLASTSERMSKQDFFNLAQSAGLNPSMIEVVMKGRRELEKYLTEQRKNSLVTKDQTDKARRLSEQFGQLKQSGAAMSREFVSSITPAIERFFGFVKDGFTWMQENQDMVQAVLVGIAGVIAAYFVPSLIAASIAAAPLIILVGGLALAIGGLWSDYQAWKKGGESLINWAKWKAELDPAIKRIGDLIETISNLGSKYNVLTRLKETFVAVFKVIGEQVSVAIKTIGGLADVIDKLLQGDFKGAFDAYIKMQVESLGDFQRIGQPIVDWWNNAVNNWGDENDGRKPLNKEPIQTYSNPNAPKGVGSGVLMSSANSVAPPQAAARLASLEQRYNLPKGLLDAVWAQESSRGKNMGPSRTGAQGHFQFMPATQRQYKLQNPNDFNQSSDAAARMYADLLRQYNGDIDKALAAYNWGSGNIQKKGMNNAPLETRNYIQQIKGRMGGSNSVRPQQYAAGARAQAAIAQPAASTGNRTTVENNIGQVVIQTNATDAKGIAMGVPMALQRSLSGATYHFDTGQQ